MDCRLRITKPFVYLQPPTHKTLLRGALLGLLFLGISAAEGQTYKVIYSFKGGSDGSAPYNPLVKIGSSLYGTTSQGGASNYGTVFKVSVDGTESILHSFSGSDGQNPESGLIKDSSRNLYGTTNTGGSVTCSIGLEFNGCGTIFQVTAAGDFTSLVSFAGTNGANPSGPLTLKNGTFYGVTGAGGQNANCPASDYEEGCGTVFAVSGTDWSESVLYNFGGGTDGFAPEGPVAFASGKLFGTTTSGNGSPCVSNVCGTAFELTSKSGNWNEKMLHAFAGKTDGAFPNGGFVRIVSGEVYGTTLKGGANGFGTIFKIDSSGTKTILYSFKGTDGAYPNGALVRDSAGNFYGTTTYGGTSKVGTIFQFDSANNLTVLHNFTGGEDGAYPLGTLLLSGSTLYGTTLAGGPSNMGTVFELSK